MKKLFLALSAISILFFCGCTITQEMQENASFESLVKFYVEEPVGTSQIFSQTGNVAEVNQQLKTSIAAYLKEKGFDEVSKKDEAPNRLPPFVERVVPPAGIYGRQQHKHNNAASADRNYRIFEYVRNARNSGDSAQQRRHLVVARILPHPDVYNNIHHRANKRPG